MQRSPTRMDPQTEKNLSIGNVTTPAPSASSYYQITRTPPVKDYRIACGHVLSSIRIGDQSGNTIFLYLTMRYKMPIPRKHPSALNSKQAKRIHKIARGRPSVLTQVVLSSSVPDRIPTHEPAPAAARTSGAVNTSGRSHRQASCPCTPYGLQVNRSTAPPSVSTSVVTLELASPR